MKAKADYNDDVDYFGTEPRPCPCGRLELTLVETTPKERTYPARVAVECDTCHLQGVDTCHGREHAIRRWNWYPPELNRDRPPPVLKISKLTNESS